MTILFAQVVERLDWFGYGISSVNRTGAFAACASLACLALSAFPRRFLFWLGFAGFIFFAYFMLQTMSRGAFLAWICGGVFYISFVFSKIGKSRSIAFIFALLSLLALSCFSGIGKRMDKIRDVSGLKKSERMELYISGLKMLSDAPQGWDMPPQDAYRIWYQSEDRSDTYLSLINSHLQFIAQHGVPLRILYLSGWIFALFLTFPKRGEIFNAVACSVFICTFICAFFSNVLNYWILWILPVSFLIAALFVNFQKFKKPKFWMICIGFSILSYSGLHAISYIFPRDVKLFKWGDEIFVGNDETKAVIIQPTGRALGSVYGREIREFLTDKDFSVCLASDTKNVKYPVAIISSDFNAGNISQIDADKIFILNAQPLNLESLDLNGKIIEVILGDMSDWRQKMYWTKLAKENPYIELTILSGVADYIPDWPKLIDGTFEFNSESEE